MLWQCTAAAAARHAVTHCVLLRRLELNLSSINFSSSIAIVVVLVLMRLGSRGCNLGQGKVIRRSGPVNCTH